MVQYPSKLIEEAVEAFAQLPGVGRKTALRYSVFPSAIMMFAVFALIVHAIRSLYVLWKISAT